MYIKQENDHIEVYEQGVKLRRKDAISLLESTLPIADEESSRIILMSLRLLRREEARLS